MTRPAFKPVKPCDPGVPKSAVRRLFDQLGGVQRVMVKLLLGQSQTYALTDPNVPDEISFARVAALTTPSSPACAEYLAGLAGGWFLPIEASGATIPDLTADCMRQHGDAAAELITAMADGQLQPAEAGKALAEIDEALRALATLRAAVAAAAGGGCTQA